VYIIPDGEYPSLEGEGSKRASFVLGTYPEGFDDQSDKSIVEGCDGFVLG